MNKKRTRSVDKRKKTSVGLPAEFSSLVHHEKQSTSTYDFYFHEVPRFTVSSMLSPLMMGLVTKKKGTNTLDTFFAA